MPIEEHPVFTPPSPTLPLWRYTNLAKFVSLVTTRSLWFSNMYHLSTDDPFEGALPVGNFLHRELTVDTMPASVRERLKIGRFGRNPDEPLADKLRQWVEWEDDTLKHLLRSTKEYFVNCWHGAETESAAMWKLYAEDSFGISIISNFDRLTSALSAAPESIMCGSVKYIDYDNERLDLSNGFITTVTKRLSFAHEREVRLLYWDTSIGDESVVTLWNGEPRVMSMAKSHADHEKILPPAGRAFPCDLEQLIAEIRIAPTAPGWFEAAVRDFCEIANLKKPISKSDLARSPMR